MTSTNRNYIGTKGGTGFRLIKMLQADTKKRRWIVPANVALRRGPLALTT